MKQKSVSTKNTVISFLTRLSFIDLWEKDSAVNFALNLTKIPLASVEEFYSLHPAETRRECMFCSDG